MADIAGIDRTTLIRIEAGQGGTIASLVGIVRALEREEWLATFAPPVPAVSPMDLLQRQRSAAETARQRAPRSTP